MKLNSFFLCAELPRYIGYIVGFSPSPGRVYFKDREGQAVLSSYNCKEVELVDGPVPDDVNDNKAMAVADNVNPMLAPLEMSKRDMMLS